MMIVDLVYPDKALRLMTHMTHEMEHPAREVLVPWMHMPGGISELRFNATGRTRNGRLLYLADKTTREILSDPNQQWYHYASSATSSYNITNVTYANTTAGSSDYRLSPSTVSGSLDCANATSGTVVVGD